jgi:VanZ family protein
MKKSRKIKAWFWWVLLTVALASILILNSFQAFTGEQTKIDIQKLTGMTEHSAYLTNTIFRKSVHILVFGFIGILFYLANRKRSLWYAWICTTLIAVLDEWHQYFVPGRTPLLQDIMLDSFAAFIFLISIAFIIKP